MASLPLRLGSEFRLIVSTGIFGPANPDISPKEG
jgi:hypothetical protein